MKMLEHGTINSAVEEGLDRHKRLKFQLQQANQNLSSEVDMLKIENKALLSTVATRDRKVAFLEKLVLEKDNGEHAARKRMKRVEKEKQELSDTYSSYLN